MVDGPLDEEVAEEGAEDEECAAGVGANGANAVGRVARVAGACVVCVGATEANVVGSVKCAEGTNAGVVAFQGGS